MREHQEVRDVDWSVWEAEIEATLMFVVGDEQLLLIRKKRGIGRGKVNGPGGKIDPGETPVDAAVRETQEELHVTPLNPAKVGELFFAMTHIPDIHCHVFRATEWEGTATETAEAVPLWTSFDELPFDEMWEDDRHWLPLMIEGTHFLARFVFEHERIVHKEIELGIDWAAAGDAERDRPASGSAGLDGAGLEGEGLLRRQVGRRCARRPGHRGLRSWRRGGTARR